MYINETIKKTQYNNTKHSKYKYTYYQNTHTFQNKLKQPQYKLKQTQHKIYPNEIVTIWSSALGLKSP
jgi:hypothetical protein